MPKGGRPAMLMKSGERWHCTNSACQLEVVVDSQGSVEGNNPRCACGALMKKKYIPPVFRYLDFLHLDEPVLSETMARKD
jgi:hypothetical protein